MNVPYTYLIGWSNLNTWYCGVRFAKNCHPDELWVKYFTSSNYVKKFRKLHGEPDIIQIRKTFKSREEAYNWEVKVIDKMNMVRNPHWLNRQNHNISFYCDGHTNETRSRMKVSHTGLKETDETKLKKSKRKLGSLNPQYGSNKSGKNNPMYGRKGELSPSYGRKNSDEHQQKALEGYFSQPLIICEFCGKEFMKGHYIQWHGNKCKLKGTIESTTVKIKTN